MDRRADIWAFGVVVYEMLTGRRLFRGEDATDTLVEVLKSDPDWTALPADTPAPIRRLLEQCLTRDPQQRWRDAADARLEIEDAMAMPSRAGGTALATMKTRERVIWPMSPSAAVLSTRPGSLFDVSPDGQRLLVNLVLEDARTPPIASIQNLAGKK